jgi:hypothetical protein
MVSPQEINKCGGKTFLMEKKDGGETLNYVSKLQIMQVITGSCGMVECIKFNPERHQHTKILV